MEKGITVPSICTSNCEAAHNGRDMGDKNIRLQRQLAAIRRPVERLRKAKTSPLVEPVSRTFARSGVYSPARLFWSWWCHLSDTDRVSPGELYSSPSESRVGGLCLDRHGGKVVEWRLAGPRPDLLMASPSRCPARLDGGFGAVSGHRLQRIPRWTVADRFGGRPLLPSDRIGRSIELQRFHIQPWIRSRSQR